MAVHCRSSVNGCTDGRQYMKALNEREMRLVAGGETEGGCVDPDPIGTDPIEVFTNLAADLVKQIQVVPTGN